MRVLSLVFLTCALVAAGQNTDRQAQGYDCHVYAVNLDLAREIVKQIYSKSGVTPDELKEAAKKGDLRLGEFKAEIGEEVTTTRSFPIPGTGSTVTVTVFFTDESMALAESVWQGVYVGDKAVENALLPTGAAITEVNFDEHTFKVLTKQRVSLKGKPWVVGLQCQTMSDERRRKLISQ